MDGTDTNGSVQIEESEAFKKALRFIEYRPRSKGETRNRLKRFGYGEGAIETVLERLERTGLLNDKYFAEIYMSEMIGKGFGRKKVVLELFKKQLNKDIVDTVLIDYPVDSELDRAIDNCRKLLSNKNLENHEINRNRVYNVLLRKGFDTDIAKEALSAVILER